MIEILLSRESAIPFFSIDVMYVVYRKTVIFQCRQRSSHFNGTLLFISILFIVASQSQSQLWTMLSKVNSYHHIISYQKFIVHPLLREPRPWVHYKIQPNAKTPRKTQKSTSVKSLTKTVWIQQFPELDRIRHGADVVGQSVPGGRTRMWERPLAELRAHSGSKTATTWKNFSRGNDVLGVEWT